MELKRRLQAQAAAEGFARMGICRPDATPETAARLRAFLEAGHHGQMGWMAARGLRHSWKVSVNILFLIILLSLVGLLTLGGLGLVGQIQASSYQFRISSPTCPRMWNNSPH